jgi:hypothetical protein
MSDLERYLQSAESDDPAVYCESCGEWIPRTFEAWHREYCLDVWQREHGRDA